jgi:hypothetical protein
VGHAGRELPEEVMVFAIEEHDKKTRCTELAVPAQVAGATGRAAEPARVGLRAT